MVAPVKTVQTVPITLQQINAATAVIKSAPINVTSLYSGAIYWDFVPVATTAAAASTNLCIQCSQEAFGGTGLLWVPLQDWASPTTTAATAAITTVTATGFTSATALAQNAWVFMYNASVATGEFHFIALVAGGGPYTYTTEDAPTAGLAGGTIYTGAMRYRFEIDFGTIKQIRFCLYNARAATTRNVASRIALTTLDNFS
jgi:hypothetical protein